MGRTDSTIESKRGQPRGDEPKEEETKGTARRSPNRIQEDDSSENGSQSDENGSQSDDDRVTEIYKDSDLYLAAKNGNLDDFKRVLDLVSAAEFASFGDILCRVSPAGNTFFHVAAKHGNEDIVTFIAAVKPSLALSKNFIGETALHLAAKAGDTSMVEALVLIHQDLLVLKRLHENEGDENNLLRAKNKRGNTAVHEALFNSQVWIAEHLIKEDPELSYYENKNGEFALYLAAKAGFAGCVSLILGLSTDQERINEMFKKKSPIQAAIQGKHRDVLEAMFNVNPSFIQLRDGEGRNPLHYAASTGYLKEVRYLLNQYAHNATQRDKGGSLPIHWASIEGHVDVIRLLLQDCPDPEELLDRNGRNILHIAAKNGRYNVVSFVLKNLDLECLINMKDKHGNTPLHLASRHWHPLIVLDLTWDKRVDITLANNRGMTALDAAVHYISDYQNGYFTQALTWIALWTADVPMLYVSAKTVLRKASSRIDAYKERANNITLVATLIATVTFAAGFTVPAGYNSSESGRDLGMATMLRHKAFHIFVFCDMIAMHSSILAVVALMWTRRRDLHLVACSVSLAWNFLWIALGMMSMAFTAGLFLVVSKLRWLSAAVLVMGMTFLVFIFLLFPPLLITLIVSRNRILRYLSYYPFFLLALLSTPVV